MGACRRPEGPFTCWPSYNSMDASMGTPPSPPSLVRQLPSAEKFSSAKPIGSKSLGQLAQGSFLRCNVCFSRTVRIFPGSPVVSSNGETVGGGSESGVSRRVSVYQKPRLLVEVPTGRLDIVLLLAFSQHALRE